MAIDAVELDRGARLAVQFSAAVAVLLEVAVHALHALLQMNVREVRGFLEFFRIIRGNRCSLFVEQVPLAVARKHGAEKPAVAVKIGKLCVFQFGIEFRASRFRQEFHIGPQPARRRAFRIALRHLEFFFLAGIALLLRIHRVAVGFVVPPGVAEIGGHHVRARMHVADHALAGRNGARKFVANGMAGFFARNRRIVRGAETAIAKRRVLRGMLSRTVIRIDDVACRASAGAIVARLIVCARQRKQRIEQARFLQAEKNRIGAKLRAEIRAC